jgi:MFS family permease
VWTYQVVIDNYENNFTHHFTLWKINFPSGPVVGGWVIEHLSWRYAFFVNVPLALLILPLTFKFVPESRNTDNAGGPDWQGAALESVATGCDGHCNFASTDFIPRSRLNYVDHVEECKGFPFRHVGPSAPT